MWWCTSTSQSAFELVADVAVVRPVVRRNTHCFFLYSSPVRNFSCSAWNNRTTSPCIHFTQCFHSLHVRISQSINQSVDRLFHQSFTTNYNNIIWKKALGETQTLRTGCSKVEPKIFAPPHTPFLGARESQNLISWRWSLPLPTNAISSYRGNTPTHSAPKSVVGVFHRVFHSRLKTHLFSRSFSP